MKYGQYVQLEIKWEYLHVIYAVLSLIKQFVPSTNTDFQKIFHAVEGALKKKIIFEQEAKRFHLCSKCYKEIDTAKDEYKHTQFESGYEIWQHAVCPAVNHGKGYEQ